MVESMTADHDGRLSSRRPITVTPSDQHQQPPRAEDSPLKNASSSSSATTPAANQRGRQLNVIVACMTGFAVITTVALIAEVARDPTQLLVHRGTIFSQVEGCTAIGRRILGHGGSAVDAAIATYMCATVASPHSASLGSGGFMLIVAPDHQMTVNFREAAPFRAPVFRQPDTTKPNRGVKVGTAGVLRGLQVAHDRFGNLPWMQLILPAFKLAEDGFVVTDSLRNALVQSTLEHPDLVQLLLRNGTAPVQVGDVVTWKTLGSTLRTIAEEGPDAFYSGNLTDAMIEDLAMQGSALTRKDFETYSAVIDAALMIPLGARTKLLVPPLPSSGPGLALVLSLLAAFNDTDQPVLFRYHRAIEAIKIATSAMLTAGSPLNSLTARVTSENMISSTSVTELRSHIMDDSAIAFDSVPTLRKPSADTSVLVEAGGTFVALISTLGSYFGSQVVASNGIIFNDAMDDFFAPTSGASFKNNFYAAGRRPLSPIAIAALLVEADQKDVTSPCSVRLIGASADFQVLAQGMLDLRRTTKPLSDVLDEPKFLVTLGRRESGGDVAIFGKTPEISASLVGELHDLGHIVYQTGIPPSPIVSLRLTGSTTEMYPPDQR